MPAMDQAALLDLRERLDRMELEQEAMFRELWAGLQQLRSDMIHGAGPGPDEAGAHKKQGGGLWRYLRGE
jgi:hypothetical protein